MTATTDAPVLELTGVDTFYGRAQILSGVSIEVRRSEVVALLGRNGAGKSTTIKSIIGLVPPAQGEISFERKSIRDWSRTGSAVSDWDTSPRTGGCSPA